MSFKRDGDDLSILNMLKHQRVSALLGAHIPEDEAKLLSNGRLTCTVCYHRPIFDTVLMLGKHRKGKRHILELSRYLKRKEELELEAVKSEQLSSLKLESLVSPRMLGCGGREVGAAERRRTLDVSITTIQPSILIASADDPSPRSSKSQVRRYLKNLHRKRSLDSLVQHKRDNYGESKQTDNLDETKIDNESDQQHVQPLKENVNKSISPPSNVKRDFSLNLSGWIKDKDGNWVKDPNAEFDSDEESPPKEEGM